MNNFHFLIYGVSWENNKEEKWESICSCYHHIFETVVKADDWLFWVEGARICVTQPPSVVLETFPIAFL